jgi:hypothetical protein
VLFGSHSRGDWVDDPASGYIIRFISVITCARPIGTPSPRSIRLPANGYGYGYGFSESPVQHSRHPDPRLFKLDRSVALSRGLIGWRWRSARSSEDWLNLRWGRQ